MREMTKKLMSLVLALALTVGLLPGAVLAEEDAAPASQEDTAASQQTDTSGGAQETPAETEAPRLRSAGLRSTTAAAVTQEVTRIFLVSEENGRDNAGPECYRYGNTVYTYLETNADQTGYTSEYRWYYGLEGGEWTQIYSEEAGNPSLDADRYQIGSGMRRDGSGYKRIGTDILGRQLKVEVKQTRAGEDPQFRATASESKIYKVVADQTDTDKCEYALSVTLSPTSYVFDGQRHKPAIDSILDGDTRLPDSTGYASAGVYTADTAKNLSDDALSAGEYTLKVTFSSTEYKGEMYVPFTITGRPVDTDGTVSVNFTSESFVYDSDPHAPGGVTVTDTGRGDTDSVVLTEGTDYTVLYRKTTEENDAATAESPTEAGTYQVVIEGAGNYSGRLASARTFTIGKARLANGTGGPVVTLPDWTYGDSAGTPAVAGNAGGGDVTYTYKEKDAADGTYTSAVPTAAGEYTVRAEIAESENYQGAAVTADFTIQKRALTVRAKPHSITYGDEPANNGVEYDGLAAGDTAASLTGTLSYSYDYLQYGNVGTYTITPAGLSGDNYDVSFAGGALTVEKKSVSVRAEDKAVAFGAAAPEYTAVFTGFVNGDDTGVLTVPADFACGYNPGDGAGTYAITPSGAESVNYAFQYFPGTLTVGKVDAAAAVTARTGLVYNGEAQTLVTAAITGGTAKYYVSDSAAPPADGAVWSAGEPSATAAGTYYVWYKVQADGNHDNIAPTYVSDVTIAKKSVTVTAEDKATAFSAAAPVFTAAYSGFAGDEDAGVLTAQPVFACTYTPGDGAGTYPITPSGAAAANYEFSYASGTLTVAPAVLTGISAEDVTADYDAADHGITVQGVPAGAAVSYSTTGGEDSYRSEAPAFRNAGEYTVWYRVCLDNYAPLIGTAAVTIRALTLTVMAEDKTTVYGQDAPEFTAAYSGFLAGEDSGVLTALPVFTCSYTAGGDAGAYSITPAGAAAVNYTFTYVPGTLTVSSAAMGGISAEDVSAVYDALPHSITVQGAGGDASVRYSTTGAAGSYQSENPAFLDAGTYTVWYQVHQDNYAPVTGSAAVTISRKPVTVRAEDKTVAFGQTAPAFTAVYDGFAGGETSDVLTAQPVFACDYAPGSSTGSYSVTPADAAAANYSFTYVPGTLTVNPAVMTGISAADVSVVYDGLYHGIVVQGVPAGAAVSYSTTGAPESFGSEYPAFQNAGDYTVWYQVQRDQHETVSGSAGVKIVPRNVTVRAENKTRVYDTENPPLTTVVTGALPGDTVRFTGPATTAAADADVGVYPITVSGEASQCGGNYYVSFQCGTLTVEKQSAAAVPAGAVTAADYTGTYDGHAHSIRVTSSLEGAAVTYSMEENGIFTTTNPVFTNAGTYTVWYRLASDNYQEVSGSARVVIGRKAALIRAENKGMAAGSPLPELTAAVSGTVGGETLSYSLATAAASDSPVGNYPITVTVEEQGNYAITTEDGVLTVRDSGAVLVTAAADSAVYDGLPHSVTASAVPADAVIDYSTDGGATWTRTPPALTGAGECGVLVRAAAEGQGSDTVHVTLTVYPRPVTVTAKSVTVTCGEAIPALEAEVSGLLDADSVTYTLSAAAAAAPEAGSYSITASGDSVQGSYSVSFVPGVLTVTRAAGTPAAVTAKAGLVYTGGSQALVEVDSTALCGGEMQYSLDNSNWFTSVPEATDAGLYTVFYRLAGDNSHTGTERMSLPVAIAPRDRADVERTVQLPCRAGSSDDGTREYDLSALLETGDSIGTIRFTDSGIGLTSAPTVSGNTLRLVITAAEKDQRATVTIPVKGNRNSGDHSLILTLVTAEKVGAAVLAEGGESSVTGVESGNLQSYAASLGSAGENVAVTLRVQTAPTVSDETRERFEAATAGLQAAAEEERRSLTTEYLDIQLEQSSGTGTGAITETGTVLEIRIECSLDGKEDPVIVREHAGTVQVFTRLAARPAEPYTDGTFYADRENNCIYIYSSQFSVYGLTYKTAKSCTVTFLNGKGGTVYGSYTQTVTTGGTAARPTVNPTGASGYSFAGWYSAAGDSPYDFNTPVMADTTLYATWGASTYTVRFLPNGGSGSMSDQAFIYGIAQNLSANAFAAPTATVTFSAGGGSVSPAYLTAPSGSFTGWRDSAGNTYTDTQSVVSLTGADKDIVSLTAQWSAGGAVSLPAPSRTGYTFTGWYSDSGLTAKVGNALDSYTPAGNLTLYAGWTANSYKVRFLPNGGSGSMSDQTFTYGIARSLSANTFAAPAATVTFDANSGSVSPASLTAGSFSGWQDDAGNAYTDTQSVDALSAADNATVNLTAQWSYGAVTLPTPTRPGYTFAGWYSDSGFSAKVGDAGDTYAPSGDITLYAKWTTATGGSSGSGSGGSGSGGSGSGSSGSGSGSGSGGSGSSGSGSSDGSSSGTGSEPGTMSDSAGDTGARDSFRDYAIDYGYSSTYGINGTSDSLRLAQGGAAALKGIASPVATGVSAKLVTEQHIVYLNGYPDGSIGPLNCITRAETAMIFYRLLRTPGTETYRAFSDVEDGEWYAQAVGTLAAMGILQGRPDGSFGPEDSITRAEFAAIASRFATVAERATVTFTDVPEDYWARQSIAVAARWGWINGYGDGTFGPDRNITRAEASAIINRMLGRSADADFVAGQRDTLVSFPDLQLPERWYYLDMVEASTPHNFSAKNGVELWTQ